MERLREFNFKMLPKIEEHLHNLIKRFYSNKLQRLYTDRQGNAMIRLVSDKNFQQKAEISSNKLQKNPYWIENNEENREKCPLLAEAREERIDARETKFWKDMIEQYLKPLYEDKDAKKKVKNTAELLNLTADPGERGFERAEE